MTGTQQSESDHYMEKISSGSGSANGEYYRDGQQFSYLMQTKGNTENVTLMARYWGADSGNRQFDILVDGTVIATESLTGGTNGFVNKEYAVPADLLKGKTSVRVMFRAKSGNTAGGVYYLRLLIPASATAISHATVSEYAGENGATYTLGGVKMQNTDSMPKGIYIMDGKKFAQK